MYCHENLEMQKKRFLTLLNLLITLVKSYLEKNQFLKEVIWVQLTKILNQVNQVLENCVGIISCMEIFKDKRFVVTLGKDGVVGYGI